MCLFDFVRMFEVVDKIRVNAKVSDQKCDFTVTLYVQQ